MDSTRQLKVSRLIQKELGEIFQRETRLLFGNALITVTQVRVSPDLGVAKVYVSLFNVPDTKELLKLIQVHTKDKPVEKGVDLKKYVHETEGMTGADIELICKRASLIAIRKAIGKQTPPVKDFVITPEDFRYAVEEIKQRQA